MENLEVILIDFNKNKVDELIYNELRLSTLKLKSSHFYDNISKEDLNFSQVKNIKEVLSPKGTGNIFLEEIQLGVLLKEVLMVLSFDEKYGDIVFNFDERNINKLSLKKLVDFLVDLKVKYNIPKVIIGYESTTDEKNLSIEINEKVTNYDKKIDGMLS